MKLKRMKIEDLLANPFSANVENVKVFNKLKEALAKHGMMSPPVVTFRNGKYVIVAGHHRIRAWQELGHNEVDVVVIDTSHLTDEEFFNLVNNLNLIRGEVSIGRLRRIIKQYRLNPKLIDLFSIPLEKILDEYVETVEKLKKSHEKLTKINELAMKIARVIAQQILDNIDDVLVVIVTDLKPVVFLNLDGFPSGKLKRYAERLKKEILEVLRRDGLLGGDDDGEESLQIDEENEEKNN